VGAVGVDQFDQHSDATGGHRRLVEGVGKLDRFLVRATIELGRVNGNRRRVEHAKDNVEIARDERFLVLTD
jgi:hypothetical protein